MHRSTTGNFSDVTCTYHRRTMVYKFPVLALCYEINVVVNTHCAYYVSNMVIDLLSIGSLVCIIHSIVVTHLTLISFHSSVLPLADLWSRGTSISTSVIHSSTLYKSHPPSLRHHSQHHTYHHTHSEHYLSTWRSSTNHNEQASHRNSTLN